MLIHSITPIEQLQYPSTQATMQAKETSFGYIYGEECIEGFKISSVFSTDPAIYMDEKYHVGSFYKE